MKETIPEIPPLKKGNRDFDSPWKEALMTFFQEFIELCFPAIAKEIDWNLGVSFLDKEFQAIIKDAATGKRHVDKLVKVYKKNGAEIWVLIHIEVQGEKEKLFPERMYVYQYRSFDYHHVPIVSIAILIDSNKNWRPHVYQSTLWGGKILFEYNMLKIIDYQDKREWLEQSTNAFAIVILAQLAAIDLAKKHGRANKVATKLALTRLLFAKGWEPTRVNHLFRFIDWLILLPAKLMIEYDKAVHEFSEEYYMTYITPFEKLTIKRNKGQWLQAGKLEGKLEEKLAIANQMLIEGMSESIIAKITKLSLEEIRVEAQKLNRPSDTTH